MINTQNYTRILLFKKPNISFKRDTPCRGIVRLQVSSRVARCSGFRVGVPLNLTLGLIMSRFEQPITVTPREYELAVKRILDASGESLITYESTHLESVAGSDGEYVIDVVARFAALGANFVVLVECKHHRRKVERQDIQILHSKLQSVGAHKAMLFSVSGFQAGALEFAKAHGIALVQFASGSTTWFTRSVGPPSPPPPWADIPMYVGWWHHGDRISVLSEEHAEYTRQALGLQANEP